MQEKRIDSFSLEGIFKKYGIPLRDGWDGSIRLATEVIEDMYLRLDAKTIVKLFHEIGEEERFGNNIFEEARQ